MAFTRPMDEVLVVLTVLRRLGSDSISKLDDRIRSQKIQYVAQLFGVSPRYGYNLYLHGPYSPELARDLFTYSENPLKLDLRPFGANQLESRFRNLQSFVEAKNTRQLELICTYHWLLSIVGLTGDAAKTRLKELKQASIEEINLTIAMTREMENAIKAC